MFYRPAGSETSFSFDLIGRAPSWAILVAVNGIDETNPVRSVALTSCDKKKQSVFPSVNGEENDLLLLSQAFDDPASDAQFPAPLNTTLVSSTRGPDEAGFVYMKTLTETGPTGKFVTPGDGTGKAACKDALISIALAAKSTNATLLEGQDSPNDAVSEGTQNDFFFSVGGFLA